MIGCTGVIMHDAFTRCPVHDSDRGVDEVQIVASPKTAKLVSLVRKWTIDGARFVALERGTSYACPACGAELGNPYNEAHAKQCELIEALKEADS